jgi:hypothetical protein
MDIVKAAKKGDLESVAFLLYQNMSLIEKKDVYDHSLTLGEHRFTMQEKMAAPMWPRSLSRKGQILKRKAT